LAKFFASDYDGGAAFIVLAHLSENNNHPQVALASAESALNPRRNLLHANLVRLAAQDKPMETITL
jgi:ureidoglycolate hydrolase